MKRLSATAFCLFVPLPCSGRSFTTQSYRARSPARTSQGLGRVFGGFWRIFSLGLLLAAFACTSLQAQIRAYVCNSESANLSVIDTSSNTVIATIPVPGFQFLFAVAAPDGKHVYTAGQSLSGGDGKVFVIDTATNTVVHEIPLSGIFVSRIAITPDGKTLYVGLFGGAVAVINAATNTVTTTISVGGGTDFPAGMAVTPNGTRLYVALTSLPAQQRNIVVVDTATNTVVAAVTGVGNELAGLAITPNGSFVYSSAQDPDEVFVTATSSNTVVAGPIPVAAPSRIAISPNGAFAYVTQSPEHTVSVISTASNTVTAVIRAGLSPSQPVFTPDGAFVYVPDAGGDKVFVIATASNTVTTTVPVGRVPSGIAMASVATPFAEFTVKDLDITRHNLEVKGDFMPGAGSSGINPAQQDVTLSVGDFSLTIPAGSFKADHDDGFRFKGTIGGVNVDFKIRDEHSERERRHGVAPEFKFSVEANGVDLSSQPNLVTVSLNIGNNTGSESVKCRRDCHANR